MHELGLQGMPRRVAMYDPQFEALNQLVTLGAYILAVSVLPFYLNVIWSWIKGPEAGPNPWNAKTLEWTTASPPMLSKTGKCCPWLPMAPMTMV
jgi:cytochrome c oxidase subunit 1